MGRIGIFENGRPVGPSGVTVGPISAIEKKMSRECSLRYIALDYGAVAMIGVGSSCFI